jgi:hypothetical protein
MVKASVLVAMIKPDKRGHGHSTRLRHTNTDTKYRHTREQDQCCAAQAEANHPHKRKYGTCAHQSQRRPFQDFHNGNLSHEEGGEYGERRKSCRPGSRDRVQDQAILNQEAERNHGHR